MRRLAIPSVAPRRPGRRSSRRWAHVTLGWTITGGSVERDGVPVHDLHLHRHQRAVPQRHRMRRDPAAAVVCDRVRWARRRMSTGRAVVVDDLRGNWVLVYADGGGAPRPPRVGDVHGDRDRHPAGQLRAGTPMPTDSTTAPGAGARAAGTWSASVSPVQPTPTPTPVPTAPPPPPPPPLPTLPAHPDADPSCRSTPRRPIPARRPRPSPDPGRVVASGRNATPHARGRRGRPRAAPGGPRVRPARGRASRRLSDSSPSGLGVGTEVFALLDGPARVVRSWGCGRRPGLARPPVHRPPGGRGHGLDSGRAADER